MSPYKKAIMTVIKTGSFKATAQIAASNIMRHLDVQNELIKTNNDDINVRLASNPHITADNQHKLLDTHPQRYEYHGIAKGLASNPNVDVSVQHRLLGVDSYYVRNGLHRNKNLHPSVREKLSPIDA